MKSCNAAIKEGWAGMTRDTRAMRGRDPPTGVAAQLGNPRPSMAFDTGTGETAWQSN